MLTYLSASTIYPVSKPPVKNGIIAIDEQGYVRGLYNPQEAQDLNIQVTAHYQGVLVPGFVNTHCHLELSHLQGKIPQQTGLFRFVSAVMKNREALAEDIVQAMATADEEMYKNGIVAVGDISNQTISASIKLQSKIYYHTFVEVLGFNPEQASAIMSKARAVKDSFAPLKASIVPHAPYSVSDPLFVEIAVQGKEEDNLLSMHNQETPAEDEFFRSKKGAFLELFKMLAVDLGFFQPTGKSSLQSTLPKLPTTKTLLVHNTQTAQEDVEFAKAKHPDLYWCLCPNANLYIESTLPDVDMLHTGGVQLTLGTDSLASNQQLSILSEMQTLQRDKGMQFQIMLQWATLNGARFLGIEAIYGSFDIGKRPGVVLLEALEDEVISPSTRITRLF